jgi:mitotic spindle assembly checkpoint protein MAD1
MQFDSPEDMARALIQERLNTASCVEKLGALRAELTVHEATISAFSEEKAVLKAEVERAKLSAGATGGDKARMRLERQRALAAKEVEYLRAQLKTFDAEDETFNADTYDQTRAKRVSELEELVDKYKAEVHILHSERSSAESAAAITTPPNPGLGSKRQRSVEPVDGPSQEQLGQLVRKSRKLQDELSSTQTKLALKEKELSVAKEQLKSAKKQSEVRILALRSNPTSDFEAIKLSTLTALRQENTELLAHIQNPKNAPSFPTVPASMLDAAQRQVAEAKAETASAQKSSRRLKEVWSAKSAEFREAIFSTLGWNVTFLPNGKMRLESVFYPSETDEHENSIVFDGERGTMKIGGGPRSAFATKINNTIKFWVRERGCIPGFLAALTVELYEERGVGPGT